VQNIWYSNYGHMLIIEKKVKLDKEAQLMKKNAGNLDRSVRIVLGAGLVVGGFFTHGGIAIALWSVGTIALLTGIVGMCPLYTVFKINTCGVEKKK